MDKIKNSHFDDCYFSSGSGYNESRYVFLDGNNLKDRLLEDLKIGETGFGTGLNLLVLEDFLLEMGCRNLEVEYSTVEKYPVAVDFISEALAQLNEVSYESLTRHLELYNALCFNLKNGWNSIEFKRLWGSLKLNIYIGDIDSSFKEYPVKNSIWFLDGHSPDKNPDMWSDKVFQSLTENSESGASFATFTAAGVVKRGLRSAGFFVKRRKGFGRKRHMIAGYLEK